MPTAKQQSVDRNKILLMSSHKKGGEGWRLETRNVHHLMLQITFCFLSQKNSSTHFGAIDSCSEELGQVVAIFRWMILRSIESENSWECDLVCDSPENKNKQDFYLCSHIHTTHHRFLISEKCFTKQTPLRVFEHRKMSLFFAERKVFVFAVSLFAVRIYLKETEKLKQ